MKPVLDEQLRNLERHGDKRAAIERGRLLPRDVDALSEPFKTTRCIETHNLIVVVPFRCSGCKLLSWRKFTFSMESILFWEKHRHSEYYIKQHIAIALKKWRGDHEHLG